LYTTLEVSEEIVPENASGLKMADEVTMIIRITMPRPSSLYCRSATQRTAEDKNAAARPARE